MTEAVLPSGKFARMRPLTGRDYLEMLKAAGQGLDGGFALIASSVTIDDRPIAYAELLEMDFRDVARLMALVTPLMAGPVKEQPQKDS